MKALIKNLWEQIRASFWFLPAVMVFGAGFLSFVSIYLDGYGAYLESLPGWLIYRGSLAGARVILSTISASMITVAGVTFSITMVALTLASSQLGLRLLRNFMRDTKNQIVLGTFISTYAYCLFVLWNFGGFFDNNSIQSVSVTFAMVLAVASLGVLIYFIHHISISIQADQAIALVCVDIEKTFKKRFSRKNDRFERRGSLGKPDKYDKQYNNRYGLSLQQSGYIKDINLDAIFNFAKENDAIVTMKHRSGDYIVADTPVLEIDTHKNLKEDKIQSLKSYFILGKVRVSDQDIEYGFNELVEIALRALSSGVNDPFTAITCIDRLSTSVVLFIKNFEETPYIFDKEGNLRIIENVVSFRGIVDLSFNQIRQNASGNPAVLIRILERLEDLSSQVEDSNHRNVLTEHADMIKNTAHLLVKEERDLGGIDERYNRVLTLLK